MWIWLNLVQYERHKNWYFYSHSSASDLVYQLEIQHICINYVNRLIELDCSQISSKHNVIMNNWYINHKYDLCYPKWRILSCSDHKYVKLLHLGIFGYYLFCVQEVKWKNISKNFPTATTTKLFTLIDT